MILVARALLPWQHPGCCSVATSCDTRALRACFAAPHCCALVAPAADSPVPGSPARVLLFRRLVTTLASVRLLSATLAATHSGSSCVTRTLAAALFVTSCDTRALCAHRWQLWLLLYCRLVLPVSSLRAPVHPCAGSTRPLLDLSLRYSRPARFLFTPSPPRDIHPPYACVLPGSIYCSLSRRATLARPVRSAWPAASYLRFSLLAPRVHLCSGSTRLLPSLSHTCVLHACMS